MSEVITNESFVKTKLFNVVDSHKSILMSAMFYARLGKYFVSKIKLNDVSIVNLIYIKMDFIYLVAYFLIAIPEFLLQPFLYIKKKFTLLHFKFFSFLFMDVSALLNVLVFVVFFCSSHFYSFL